MIDIDFKVVYKNLKEVGHKQEPAIPLKDLTWINFYLMSTTGVSWDMYILFVFIWGST